MGLIQNATESLGILKLSRLIEPRRQGKNNYYGLTDAGGVLADAARAMVGGIQ